MAKRGYKPAWTASMLADAGKLWATPCTMRAAYASWKSMETEQTEDFRSSVCFFTWCGVAGKEFGPRKKAIASLILHESASAPVVSTAEYLKLSLQKILLIPDSHHPLHNRAAWELMMRVAERWRPDIILLLGDFLDFESLSMHAKSDLDGEGSALKETEEANASLDRLDALGAKTKILVSGNHEHRLKRVIARMAPALDGAVSVPGLLRLAERGWEWVDYQEVRTLGQLNITHDTGSAGMYAHVSAQLKIGGNVAIGHAHLLGMAFRGGYVGACFGHLTSKKATRYMSPAHVRHFHQLGFGTGSMAEDGKVWLQPHPIFQDRGHGYRVVFQDQLFQLKSEHEDHGE